MKVLLIDDAHERSAALEQSLIRAGCEVVGRIRVGRHLLARIAQYEPDVIIMDTDSPSRDMLESLTFISQENPRPVVMYADEDDPDIIRQAIEAGVSVYVGDRASSDRVRSAVSVAIAQFRHYAQLKDELKLVRQRLDERKLVEQAKGLIMAQRGVSEAEAYQWLRKTAMDRHQKLIDVAHTVISLLAEG